VKVAQSRARRPIEDTRRMQTDAGADPTRCELIERIRLICGEHHVITDHAALETYRSDGLLQYRQTPLVAVLPGAASEVQAVVRACHQAGVPFVARGAGTGLAGGALPVADGVLIVLTRMRRILSVDLDNAEVVVEPGVPNSAVSRAVAPTHFYPPDPSSQVVSTIGGNVAANAGGAHCLKYGVTTDYVTGLDVVLADGTLVELRRGAPGYDLLGPFVGSEGTLGIAVAIYLRVRPVPESVALLMAFFESPAAAGDAVTAIVGAGILPAAIELMDRDATTAGEQAIRAGFRTDAGAALLIELDGSARQCEAQLEHAGRICGQQHALEVRLAGNAAERELLWRLRKAALPALGRIASTYYVGDSVIPRTRLGDVLRRIEQISADQGLRVVTVLHAGDGNLHPHVFYDPGVPGESDKAKTVAGEIAKTCVEAGGSITGEHGVGVDKVKYMSLMFSEADLDAFERLRGAFDPDGLANPGKVMPAA
jgi:glycolate oxidase